MITVNCAGGWVDDLYKNMGESNKKRRYFNRSIAFNLVTRGIHQDRFLLGFSSFLAGKMNDQMTLGPILFTLNWGKHTLFGTKHIPDHSINWSQPFPESIVQEIIDEINSGFPEADLHLDDIVDVLWGYLPMRTTNQAHMKSSLSGIFRLSTMKKTRA
jgi:glycerol-3-phosphate dehydrogenase